MILQSIAYPGVIWDTHHSTTHCLAFVPKDYSLSPAFSGGALWESLHSSGSCSHLQLELKTLDKESVWKASLLELQLVQDELGTLEALFPLLVAGEPCSETSTRMTKFMFQFFCHPLTSLLKTLFPLTADLQIRIVNLTADLFLETWLFIETFSIPFDIISPWLNTYVSRYSRPYV